MQQLLCFDYRDLETRIPRNLRTQQSGYHLATKHTQKEGYKHIRQLYISTSINITGAALHISVCGVTYHLTGQTPEHRQPPAPPPHPPPPTNPPKKNKTKTHPQPNTPPHKKPITSPTPTTNPNIPKKPPQTHQTNQPSPNPLPRLRIKSMSSPDAPSSNIHYLTNTIDRHWWWDTYLPRSLGGLHVLCVVSRDCTAAWLL